MSAADRDARKRLYEAAEEIADARRVDWNEQASGADDPQTTTWFENLRLLETLAEAFRAAVPPEPSPERPQALFSWGRLQVLEKLGEGSFGEILRAYDPTLEREVALKLRREAPDSGTAGSQRFIREARRLARLRHPHVVSVYGADENDARAGFWTELIDGFPLTEVIDQQGPMSAEEALSVGREVCGALAAVHRVGMVHGDVKPSNVMRERGGRYVLVDFGAASLRRADVADAWSEGVQGTPAAMAPELLAGNTPSVSSDIYSLGVLLYYLVTGTYPVTADALDELIEQHRNGQLVPLRDRRPDLPASFLEILDRALDEDPAGRYRSAGAMEQALVRAMGASVNGTARAAHSRRRLWWAVTTGVVALGALGIWIYVQVSGHETGRQQQSARARAGALVDECTSNAACTQALGTPAICRQSTCVALLNADCPFVFGDFRNDDAILVGLTGALTGPTPQHREWTRAHICAVEMTMTWWRDNPLPQAESGKRRPLAVLVCDGYEGNKRSLDHLVDSVGVKLVGGPNFSAYVLAHAPELSAAGIFMLSPTAGAPQLLDMADDQLFWSVQPNSANLLPVYPALLEQAETWAREEGTERDLNVALVADGDAVSRGFAQNLIESGSLVFNGLPASRQTGANFCPVYLCDAVTDPACTNEASVARLTQCDPDIVLYFAINLQWVNTYMMQVEDAGTQPLWLFPFRDGEIVEAVRSSETQADLRPRVLAIDWTNEANPTYAKFKAGFTGACPDHVPPAVDAFPPLTENFYDWVSLAHLLYLANGNAMISADDLTGENLADALTSLNHDRGTPVELVSGNIPELIQMLVADVQVDIHGASGELDFEAELGTPSRPAEIFCISPGLEPPATAEWAGTGLTFNPSTGRLEGEFACPR